MFCTEGESQWFVQKRNVSFLYRKGDNSDLMQKKDGMSVFICRDVCVCNGKGMAVILYRDVSVCYAKGMTVFLYRHVSVCYAKGMTVFL